MFFKFQNPEFGWLILILLLVFILRRLWGKHATHQFPSNWAINHFVKRKKLFFSYFLNALRVLNLLLIIFVLMRPQVGRQWTEEVTEGIDIMLAVDLSGSMLAHDFEFDGDTVSRLNVVKRVISDFIDRRQHDRMGLLVFAEEPFLVSPLTFNHSWLKSVIDNLDIGSIASNATAIGSAIGMGTNRLRNVKSPSKILILLTDGENNSGEIPPIAAAEAANSFDIKVYTIGVGKTGSVLMPRRQGDTLLLDEQGKPIMDWVESDIDENTLREVANITTGSFYRATSSQSLQNVYDEIDQLEKRESRFVTQNNASDIFYTPLHFIFLLVLVEIILTRIYLFKLP